MTEHTRDLALVFAGGNAVGSYHAGVYETLHARGHRPGWVVGASIGAVTAAIIAGNAPEDRVAKLGQFWEEATLGAGPSPTALLKPRQVYNGLHALLALAWGRPNIFRHRLPGLWSALPWMPDDVALFDNAPLLRTLTRLVDFERLNRGDTRLTVACVDIESGEEVYFDSAREAIRPEHILASTALPPAFPPVEIDGRVLCDAGYTNNLPLDPVFATEPERDLLCIASDLFSPRAPRPKSLDAVLERANDLIFASAPRRTIAGLARTYDLRQRLDPTGPTVTLLHLVHQAGADQLAAKSFDFSPASIRDRWAAGVRDAVDGLRRLPAPAPDGRRFTYVATHRPSVSDPASPGRAEDGPTPRPGSRPDRFADAGPGTQRRRTGGP
ncbi:patatin-like phospholipase family protein [Methylobacterium sp. J-070]|uniref:patatin-like phospholipase family protein n=1 Tax=Methylobacterium sp. J-070 TaxID=2836650 RepID=UPI001FB8E692|nr:patatin-like phospholipase family protein [Methylobacterium sp. J-070]MCJ2048849.1 patatin-like phospholipase family protein [Methylobacterium sp. J-070]